MIFLPHRGIFRGATVFAAASLLGCSDRDEVTLQTFDGSLSLTYSCSSFEPMATSALEFELLGEMAMTGYRHAMANGKSAEAAELPVLTAEGNFVDLEPAVANYFCQNRDAVDAPRPPMIRRSVQVDSIAPNFTRPLLTSTTSGITEGSERVSLASFRGKFVVLHPVAVWCVSCAPEQKKFVEFSATLPDNVVALGFVTGARSLRGASAWLTDNGGLPPYPMLFDVESRIANRYGMSYFPISW